MLIIVLNVACLTKGYDASTQASVLASLVKVWPRAGIPHYLTPIYEYALFKGKADTFVYFVQVTGRCYVTT